MTSRELSKCLRVSRSFLNRRAKKEGWPFTARRGRGGEFHDYDVLKLPADVRGRIKTAEILRDKALDWLDRLFGSPYFDVACMAVCVLAFAYFGATVAVSILGW